MRLSHRFYSELLSTTGFSSLAYQPTSNAYHPYYPLPLVY